MEWKKIEDLRSNDWTNGTVRETETAGWIIDIDKEKGSGGLVGG